MVSKPGASYNYSMMEVTTKHTSESINIISQRVVAIKKYDDFGKISDDRVFFILLKNNMQNKYAAAASGLTNEDSR